MFLELDFGENSLESFCPLIYEILTETVTRRLCVYSQNHINTD